MKYNATLTRLYFLLIYADGKVNEKEIEVARLMIQTEGLNETEFNAELEYLKSKDKNVLLADCIALLKTLDQKQQVRIIAWLCVVANADGFMDRNEWQLIYKIYHKELGLPLHAIFDVQKQLNRLNWQKYSMSFI